MTVYLRMNPRGAFIAKLQLVLFLLKDKHAAELTLYN